jgi:23S rRNA (cytidine1920-2'-O)/16S rRNA (cytidine1409-2'-O)-methyltransferase
LLLAGQVRVGAGDGARSDRKPGEMVDPTIPLERLATPRFVSRGGEKLAGALDAFEIDVRGWVCLDVGASTGGFTDCLLQRGASRVYALDVGRGQLAESLRADPRVISLERTHARRLDPTDPDAILLAEGVSLAVIDVSFISVTRILPGVVSQMVPGGTIVSLVKPQFESQPREVPKGVVRDPAIQARAVDRVRQAAIALGLEVRGECPSPLVGPAGNREFFLHLAVAA